MEERHYREVTRHAWTGCRRSHLTSIPVRLSRAQAQIMASMVSAEKRMA